MKRWALALAVIASSWSLQGRAEAPTLKSVLAQLANIEALSARFHEEKQMALLAAPLASDGRLYYQKPRMLARHTERPHKASVLLMGDELSFGDASHAESMELSSQPALRVLVDTFVSVLAGDMAALERVASLKLTTLADGGYRIDVLPKDEKVKRLVRSMAFEGKGASLSRMELLDANGDTTLTTFTAVELRKPFGAPDLKKLFRIGG
jgi:outer membrane lipoprotein-sorting protein